MKTSIACGAWLLLGLISGVTLSAQTGILFNDHFYSASANNLNAPNSGAYFASSSSITYTQGNAGTSTNGSLRFNASRLLVGHLTAPTGAMGSPTYGPATLGIGESVTLSIVFSMTGVAGTTQPDGLRLGLFDSSTGSRLAGNLANSTSDPAIKSYQGYFTSLNVSSTLADSGNPIQFLQHASNASSAALIQNLSGTGYSNLGTGGTKGVTFASGTQYLASLEYTLINGTTLGISYNLSTAANPGVILQSATVQDTTSPYLSFDTLAIQPMSGSMTNFTLHEVTLAHAAIPEPASFVFAGGVVAFGFVVWRRRRKTA